MMKFKNLKFSRFAKTLLAAGAILVLCNKMDAEALTAQNNASKLNIRYSNSETSEILGRIPKDASVEKLATYDEKWDLILYKDNIGFVCSDYLTIVDDSDPSYSISFENRAVITTDDVNLRLGPSAASFDTIDCIPSGTMVGSIGYASDGNYFLVQYDGKIGFISMEYARYAAEEDINKLNEAKESKIKVGDVVYTTTELRFREGPGTNYNKISTIDPDTGLKILAIENGWYRVNYDGRDGYVFSKYTSVNKESKYRDDFIAIVSAKDNINLRTSPTDNGLSLYVISKHEVCEVLSEDNGWYFVRANGMTGYIEKSRTDKISNTAVVVDISEQTLTLYKNSSIFLETDVVTGELGQFDTPTGKYAIQKKKKNTYLTSEKYNYNCHVDYWMPFNGGYGLHDADWRGSFGGDIYKKSGSHGCVNIPPKYADDVYNEVSVGTLVLVHK